MPIDSNLLKFILVFCFSGIVITLPILLPPLHKTARHNSYFFWSMAIFFMVMTFVVAYGLVVSFAIEVSIHLTKPYGLKESFMETHRAEIKQEAWRASMLPSFLHTVCDLEKTVCDYIYLFTISFWKPNSLHFFALLPTMSSFLFCFIVYYRENFIL